jgi:hypothetical protein
VLILWPAGHPLATLLAGAPDPRALAQRVVEARDDAGALSTAGPDALEVRP